MVKNILRSTRPQWLVLIAMTRSLSMIMLDQIVLPITVAAQIGGRCFDRVGVRKPVLTGLAIGAMGIVARAVALPSLSYWLSVPGMVLMGIGLGLTISPTNTDSLNRVASPERGQASGLVQTVRSSEEHSAWRS